MDRVLKPTPVTIFILILGLAAIISSKVMTPPASSPFNAPAKEFSGQRALRFTKTMLAEDLPHYTGSEQQFVVRDRILKEFQDMGYEPEVQSGFADIFMERFSFAENIVATLPGELDGKYIILTGHYDSVRASPTSLCDANGVGAIMEIARALKQRGPNKHTIIFLLTDAEESGLQGAFAFRNDNPAIVSNTLAVLSVDRIAPGMVGLPFCRGPESGWIESALVKSAPRPVCSSTLPSYTDRLPQEGGDSAVFFDQGITGLHFGGYSRFYYHMPMENSEILEPNHLQEFGDRVLPLTVALANDTSTHEERYKLVYGGLAGLFYFSWPESWNYLLVGLMAILTTVVVVLGQRRGRLTPKTLGLGFARWGAMIAILAGSGFLLNSFSHQIAGSAESFPANFKTLIASAWATSLLICLICGLPKCRSNREISIGVGGLIGLVVCALALTIFLPGATYLVIVPGIAATALYSVSLARDLSRRAYGIIDGLVCLVSGLLIFQLLIQIHELAGINDLLLPMVLLGIPLTFVLQNLASSPRFHLVGWISISAVFLVTVIAVTVFSPTFHDNHPVEMNIFYVQDADSGEAWWSVPKIEDRTEKMVQPLGLVDIKTIDRPYTEWLQNFHRTQNSFPSIVSQAPSTKTQAPNFEIISSQTVADTIRVKMRIWSPRGADEVGLLLPPNTKRTFVDINGLQGNYSGEGPESWREYEIFAQSMGRIVITFEFLADQPLETWIYDSDPVLPDHSQELLNARPQWATKRHVGDRWMIFRKIILGESI